MKTTALSTLIIISFVCLGLLPRVYAVVPAPDGGYPGGNTAEGQNALFSLTTGGFNAAVGYFSLFANAIGSFNTAVGAGALDLNTADSNTAIGAAALLLNTTGSSNTAIGTDALVYNDIGSVNTAVGTQALFNNNHGGNNTATGFRALYSNTSGDSNCAFGDSALYHNTGIANTAIGPGAGASLTTGQGNVCIGADVLGVAGESNTTRIRNIYSSVASARAVYVNSDNKIGTLASSRRFKEEIKPMEKASETILGLKPVTFRYKKDIDPSHALSFGLIAEDVAKVSPELITRDEKGNPQTVRYDAVNAMLLNEFLKEHRKVEQQRKDFEAAIARQQKQIEALTAGLQKVSAQLQVGKAAPKTVLNNQ
jgi:hypothetical protein